MDCGRCATGHAVVAGCGHLGVRIAQALLERGCRVVVIEKDPDAAGASRLESRGCVVVRGDARDEEVLDEAGVSTASCYIAATGDDRANLESAVAVRRRGEQCTVVSRLYDQALGERVEKAFGIRALSASSLASPAFVSAATDDSIISALTVDGCCLSIRAASSCLAGATGRFVEAVDSALHVRQEPCPNCFFAEVYSSGSRSSAGHRRLTGRAKRRTPRPAFFSLLRLVGEAAGGWKHASTITRRLVAGLVAVLAISVAVFSTFGRMSPLDALYFVVTTMATVGYGDINLQNASPGLKLYGIVLMLCGAALLATVYAIIADRVLAARVEHLLGHRRVNLRDHTIVVGLGKVGYRVAVELHDLGVQVVGVEAVPDSDNVSSARSLFPVVVGDASRASILAKAAADAGDTILALTDDPLLNLSVALSAREQNPAIRTIVRTYDVGLAEKLASSGLDVAISTSAIAAPAFVDAAIYPEVQGSFRFGNSDIVVARQIIDSGSPWLGQTPEQISENRGIAIIAVANPSGDGYHPADLTEPLQEGQVTLALLTRESVAALGSDR